MCEIEVPNNFSTVKLMVGIKVDCFSGNFDKTGIGIDDKAAQYDSVHVASDGGLLEIKGVFAM